MKQLLHVSNPKSLNLPEKIMLKYLFKCTYNSSQVDIRDNVWTVYMYPIISASALKFGYSTSILLFCNSL